MNTSINSLSDPKYIGPGVWFKMHLKGYEAVDDTRIEEFMDDIYLLAIKFPCKKCRKHINKYIEDHPFDDLINLTNDDNRRIGMFKWAWLFHNAVNTRIKKPLVDWETAWGMYDHEIEACSKNCNEVDDVDEGDQSDQNPTNQIQTNQNQPNPNQSSNISGRKHYIEDLPINPTDRKSKLVQGYFMKIGIPNTLKNNKIEDNFENMISYRSDN